MSSLMPPEKRKLSSSGSPIDDQPAGLRVEDVVDALPQRGAGRDHLQCLDQPGLLTRFELCELIPGSRRHQQAILAGFSHLRLLTPAWSAASGDATSGRPGRLTAPSAARTASRSVGAVRRRDHRRSPNFAASATRGGRDGRPSAARRSARSRRSTPAARGVAERHAAGGAAPRPARPPGRRPARRSRTPPTTLTNTSRRRRRRPRGGRARRARARGGCGRCPLHDAPRRHELGRRHERLDLDEQRPRALHRGEHDAARRLRRLADEARADASSTSTRPPSRISKTPTSFVEPKRFFSARSVR